MKKLLVLIVMLLSVPASAEMTEKEKCSFRCDLEQVKWNQMCAEKYKDFWDRMACGQKYKIVDDKCQRDCGCNPDRAGYGDMCK